MAQQDEDYSTMILVMSQWPISVALLFFFAQLFSQIQERPGEFVHVGWSLWMAWIQIARLPDQSTWPLVT